VDWEVIWTEPALVAFEEAIRYLADRNLVAAEAMRLSILAHVENLARFPHIGPRYERDTTGRSREIVCGPYRIFYRLDESANKVQVLTIWHGARREPELPD
jgi:toxin ParE1/3/4